MARSHRSSEGKSLLQRVRRLRYLIVLITGGLGVGGWQLKDHPVLQRIIQVITQADPKESLLDGNVVEKAVDAIEHTDPFHDAGTFEVTVATVKVDPALIRSGRASDIQVRVRKRDAEGHEMVLWDSNKSQTPSVDTLRGAPAVSWPDDPFRAEWAPGDRFSIDVWAGRGLLFTRHFEASLGEADKFPLRSGAHDLTLEGQSLPASDANQIVFQTRRVGDVDTNVQRTAAKSQAPRDDDTIVIK